MDALAELSWRGYPAAALMLLGAALFARGVATMVSAWRNRRSDLPVVHMTAFRLSVVGLALAGLGASWAWQQLWLLALSLAVGGEELLESSICVYALRRYPRLVAAARGRMGAA